MCFPLASEFVDFEEAASNEEPVELDGTDFCRNEPYEKPEPAVPQFAPLVETPAGETSAGLLFDVRDGFELLPKLNVFLEVSRADLKLVKGNLEISSLLDKEVAGFCGMGDDCLLRGGYGVPIRAWFYRFVAT